MRYFSFILFFILTGEAYAGLWTSSAGESLKTSNSGERIYTQGAGNAVPACAICHGQNGEGNVQQNSPAIAGMQSAYLQAQIVAFRKKTRANPTMQDIALSLSKEQTQQLAEYINTLPGASKVRVIEEAPSSSTSTLLERGRLLFQYGKRVNNKYIPACALCHGNEAEGGGEFVPPLASQNARYIEAQLEAWKTGTRFSDPNQLMKTIAIYLDGDDIKAVAAYLQAIKSVSQPIWPFAPEKRR